MKKAYKALSILMIVFMIASICSNVFAAINISDINANKDLGQADSAMGSIGSIILTAVTNVAMILAVVVIAIIGVKYMMESSEGKAEYKKTMMPYLIGAVLVFGAGAIGKMVIGLGQSVAGGETTPDTTPVA